MINYHQDNSINLLHLAKFTYNNTYCSSFGHTCHFLWTMDDTYRFNTLAMGRKNNLVVKDFIERSPTTWTISYYWWNIPNYISIITFEINENLPNIRCFNSWTLFMNLQFLGDIFSHLHYLKWMVKKILKWKKSWIRKFLVNIWNA